MAVDWFANGLCMHCFLAKDELLYFSAFHSNTESYWEGCDKDTQSHVAALIKKFPDEDPSEIIDSYGEELHLNQIKFPNLHRESLLITMQNYLENNLNELCRIIFEHIESNVNLKDLKGSGVMRSVLFLKKVANFDLSSLSNQLGYIYSVIKLRNHIVHNGAMLPQDENHPLIKFISGNPHLRGGAGEAVWVSSDFICEYNSVLIEFFDRLDCCVQEFMQKH